MVINGTSGDDLIHLSLRNGALVVSGLTEEVVVEHFDPTLGQHPHPGPGAAMM